MRLRFISPTVHGIIDYSAALALITGPFLLNIGADNPTAKWFSVIVGIAVILVSTNTIYKYGIFKTISFDGHLAIDLMAATAFAIVPFLFEFEGIDLYYY